MTDEQLKRLAELLGWEYRCGSKMWPDMPSLVNGGIQYKSPRDNNDLMLRLMVEYKLCVMHDDTNTLWWAIHWADLMTVVRADNIRTAKTPQISVLHAVLAKLEASCPT